MTQREAFEAYIDSCIESNYGLIKAMEKDESGDYLTSWVQGRWLAWQAALTQKSDMEARKDAAYLERNQVVAALAKCFPSGIAKTAIEGWSEDWNGCVYIDLPTGQVSWHFQDSQAYLFEGLPAYSGAWDGHTTDEKYIRVAALAQKEAQPDEADKLLRALGLEPETYRTDCGYINPLKVKAAILHPDEYPTKVFGGVLDPDYKGVFEQKEAQQEPVGYWQGKFSPDGGATLYEEKQESVFGRTYLNIPCYTTPQPDRAVLEQALGALEESRDDVNDCLYEAMTKAGYERWDVRIAAFKRQLVKHDAAIAAIRGLIGGTK